MNISFLTNDLLFSSRVTGIAEDQGHLVKIAPNLEQLVAVTETFCPSLILLDLSSLSAEVQTMVTEIRRVYPQVPIVAYGPHVHTARLTAAREAECEQVMTRGTFDQQIGNILSQHAAN